MANNTSVSGGIDQLREALAYGEESGPAEEFDAEAYIESRLRADRAREAQPVRPANGT